MYRHELASHWIRSVATVGLILSLGPGCNLIAGYSSRVTDAGVYPVADTRGPDLADLSAPRDAPGGEMDGWLADADGPLAIDASMLPGFGVAELHAALHDARVPCVDRTGIDQGYSEPIIDRNMVKLLDAAAIRSDAPPELLEWLGDGPSALVVYDPNACDKEDPFDNDGDWRSAGLLIRGAMVNEGRLFLAAGATIDDTNLINVTAGGAFQREFAEPDDSGLPSYPQLLGPITRAKEIILELGQANL